jgi:DNA-binding winged helix-turn-helix (wHTH) protein
MGDWLVEPELDRVTRDGEKTSLRPQVMNMLVYLCSRPRETVSVDEILAEVWRGRVTTPASVYNCLMELRHALGDDPHRAKYIETIPKRGYRLIAEVRNHPTAGETRSDRSAPSFSQKLPQLFFAGLVLVFAVILVSGRYLNPRALKVTRNILPTASPRKCSWNWEKFLS